MDPFRCACAHLARAHQLASADVNSRDGDRIEAGLRRVDRLAKRSARELA
jgi:hypothetical protein